MVQYRCAGCRVDLESPETMAQDTCPICGTVNAVPQRRRAAAPAAPSAPGSGFAPPAVIEAAAPPQSFRRSRTAGDRGRQARPNLLMAVIGASIGAAIGAGIWCAIEYFINMQFGYVAILCGALAGWGAATMAQEKSPAVGGVAAIAGLLAIIVGSCLSFRLLVQSDATHKEVEQMVLEDPEFAALTEQERKTLVEQVVGGLRYTDVMGAGDLAWLGFFGLLGLLYGYRTGAGAGGD